MNQNIMDNAASNISLINCDFSGSIYGVYINSYNYTIEQRSLYLDNCKFDNSQRTGITDPNRGTVLASNINCYNCTFTGSNWYDQTHLTINSGIITHCYFNRGLVTCYPNKPIKFGSCDFINAAL